MKKIIAVILLLQISLLLAGTEPNVAIDPETPLAGENFTVTVMRGDCSGPTDHVIEIDGNEIKLFVRFVGGSPCPDPPPPPFHLPITEISGLDEGVYNLQYYMVGELDDLPPLPVDYPLFFVEEIQFQVLGNGGPTAVDATSTVSLITLLLLMFGVSYFYTNRR